MEYLLISSRNVSRSSTESSYVKTYPSTTDNPEQTNNNLNVRKTISIFKNVSQLFFHLESRIIGKYS